MDLILDLHIVGPKFVATLSSFPPYLRCSNELCLITHPRPLSATVIASAMHSHKGKMDDKMKSYYLFEIQGPLIIEIIY